MKKIRRKKGNKRIQIKNKNKIRKKIYFKKRKLIHNDNNSEAKTNYSENIDEVFTVSKEYYNKIEKIIGAGTFGEIYQGVDIRSGTKVAVKRIKKKLLYENGNFLLNAYNKKDINL